MVIEKIKKMMQINNMNQRELAEKCSLTPVAISRFLSGHRKVTVDFAIKISDVFGVSLDWLLK